VRKQFQYSNLADNSDIYSPRTVVLTDNHEDESTDDHDENLHKVCPDNSAKSSFKKQQVMYYIILYYTYYIILYIL